MLVMDVHSEKIMRYVYVMFILIYLLPICVKFIDHVNSRFHFEIITFHS